MAIRNSNQLSYKSKDGVTLPIAGSSALHNYDEVSFDAAVEVDSDTTGFDGDNLAVILQATEDCYVRFAGTGDATSDDIHLLTNQIWQSPFPVTRFSVIKETDAGKLKWIELKGEED